MEEKEFQIGSIVKINDETYTVESVCYETKRIWLEETGNWVYFSHVQN